MTPLREGNKSYVQSLTVVVQAKNTKDRSVLYQLLFDISSFSQSAFVRFFTIANYKWLNVI